MGSGTEKRRRMDAIRAAAMSDEGRTHREIAETIGLDVSRVKARIELGRRLRELDSTHNTIERNA